MKLTTLLMIIGCMQLHAAVFSQTINLSEKNASLETIISKIEKQSGYNFFSRLEVIRAMPKVNVDFKNVPLREALDQLLSKLSLSYTIIDKTVVINVIPQANATPPPSIYIGKVLDEKGQPLPGVGVKFKGTKTGTTTNVDGEFRTPITNDPKAILVISYIGYTTQEIPVSELKSPIVIRLKLANSDLDQVQVMAYTTVSKRLNVSNVQTITAAEIAKHPVSNILDIIKDRVPGLFVQQNTGLPGGSYEVTIRGYSSFNNNSPLYIIDGVAFPASENLPLASVTAGASTSNNHLLGGNALNYVNSADVESISILTDADATAVYGSRGAHGVILITTKRGKEGKPRLNVNTNTGIAVRGSFPKLLNTEQYLMIRREAFKNDGLTPGPSDLDLNGTWPEDRYSDWQRELTGHDAISTAVNASYSGGNGNTNFLISGNYNKVGSIERGKGSNRSGGVNFNINNSTANKKFYIDLSGGYSSTLNDAVPIDFSGSTTITSAPNAPKLLLPDGSLNWETGSNPLASLNLQYRNVTNNLTASSEMRYIVAKGLTLKSTVGFNVLSANEFRGTPTTAFNPAINSINLTTSIVNTFNIRTFNFDPNILYETALGRKGSIKAVAGLTLQDRLSTQYSIRGTNFTTDALLINPATAVTVLSTYNKVPTRYIGFFGLINYNWDNKYLLNISGRRDGSTKFGPNRRFGNFGSIGAAWLLSEESWFKDNISVINFAKLRGSYGTLGGDAIGNYLFINRFDVGADPYQGKPVYTPSTPANQNLQWSTTKKVDLGVNIELFKSRIGFDINYYWSMSSNGLGLTPLSSITGVVNYTENIDAKIENKGMEYVLNTRNIEGKNFSWSTRFQISMPRNKLVSYSNIEKLQANFNLRVGEPVGGVTLFKYAGVDPKTGNYFFVKPGGEPGQNLLFTLNPNNMADRTEYIDLQPKYFGSISNTFTYKKFSVDFTFTARKRTGLNFLGQQGNSPGYFNVNSPISALNRWQKEGDITDVPRATTNFLTNVLGQSNFKTSTGAYETITYARLQNLNINYNFNPVFLKKMNVTVLSVFLRGENLLTISKYGDMDPENLNIASTPQLRVFTAGFNITL